MGAKAGPSIETSDLILHYDLDDATCYAGEPTVNLVGDWMNSLSSSIGSYSDGGSTGSAAISADSLVGFKITLEKTNSSGRQAINKSCGVSATSKKTHSCLVRVISYTSGAQISFYSDYYSPTHYGVGLQINMNNMSVASSQLIENYSVTNVFRDWYLIKFTTTFTDSTSGSHFLFITTQPGKIEIAKYQIENKDHYTNYVGGTRSSTDAIKDLSGNNYHASFYSAAQFQNQKPFYPPDSTNGQIGTQITSSASSNLNLGTGDISVELWFKQLSGAAVTCGLFTHGANGGGNGYGIRLGATGQLSGEVYGTLNSRQSIGVNTYAPLNQFNQVVYIFSVPDLKVYYYLNGQYANQFTILDPGNVISPYSNAHFGTSHGDYFRGLNGFISILRVYKRKLVAPEILDNFNSQKKRFNL